MRRMQLEQLGRVGEIFWPLHRVDLLFRRSFDVDARIDIRLHRDCWLAPARQRRDLETFLDGVDRVIVRGAIGLRTADDPDIGRRRIDACEVRRHIAIPARRDEQEIARLCARRTPARRGEYVGPHVEHGQEIVATTGVGHRNHHRFAREVNPAARIQRVEIGPHDRFHIGGRESRNVIEGVHRPADTLAGLGVDELLARQIHGDERIKVEVRVDGDGACFHLADCRRAGLCVCTWDCR